jgi:hypothetical protein
LAIACKKIRLICPKDISHDRFIGIAKVKQSWLLNAGGELISIIDKCSSVTESPNDMNEIVCIDCNVRARIFSNCDEGYLIEYLDCGKTPKVADMCEIDDFMGQAGSYGDYIDRLGYEGQSLVVQTAEGECRVTRLF